MQLEKVIKKYFKFVRTWDVTKELPEGSVDEYEFRCSGFLCRLMYYKAREWEEPHWKLEAYGTEYPYRELKIDWLKDLGDLINCINIFYNVDEKVGKLHKDLTNYLLTTYKLN